MRYLSGLMAVLFLAAALSGCGYTRASAITPIPWQEPIAVKMFANRTYQPNLESDFRKALLYELISSGRSVSDDQASFVISGELLSLVTDATAFSSDDKARFYKLEFQVTLELTDRKTGKVVWKGSDTVRQDYPANEDLALQRNAHAAAVQSICGKAAQQLLSRMNSSF